MTKKPAVDETLVMFRLRLINDLREDGGRWYPDDPKTLTYAKKCLADLREEEPRSGWRLERRDVHRDWYKAED